jgi:hypothetical protein
MQLTSLLRKGVSAMKGMLTRKGKVDKKIHQQSIPEKTVHIGEGRRYSFGTLFAGTHEKRKLKRRKRRKIANASKRGLYLTTT